MSIQTADNNDFYHLTEPDATDGFSGDSLQDERIFPVIPFPLDIFPRKIRDLIVDIAESHHVDSAVIAGSLLTILSGAIGNSTRVIVKHGWTVPLFLWLMIIAKTGHGKSHAINALMEELNRMQGERWQQYQAALSTYESELQEYDRKRKDKKAPCYPKPILPVLSHVKTDDPTVASLVNIFLSQPRGVILNKDELAGLILSFDQFKGGKGNDKQAYLTIFDASNLKVDRVKNSTFVHNTGLAIIGGLQPSVMPQIFAPDSIDDGFFPRFIVVCADDRPMVFCTKPIKEEHLLAWKKLVSACYQIPLELDAAGFVRPKLLALSGKANAEFVAFYNDIGKMKMYLTPRMQAFVPKLITYSLKFTGLLHILYELCNDKSIISPVIEDQIVRYGIKLTKYYAGQVTKALRFYGDPGQPLNEQQLRLIRSLFDLQSEVRDGRLYLSIIRDKYNLGIPESIQLSDDNKSLGWMLKKLRLTSEKGTGGIQRLNWEADKLAKLFLRTNTTNAEIRPVNENLSSERNTTNAATEVEEKNIYSLNHCDASITPSSQDDDLREVVL